MTRPLRLPAMLCTAWLLAGCGGPPSDRRFTITAPPRDSFPQVGDVLEGRCGSLDCHGVAARNLRVYGYNGLRLDPAAVSGRGTTTAEEYEATYESVVVLEPELLTKVVSEGGAGPERLTLIKKGRGQEHHKGHQAMAPGDAADRCLTTWLAGAPDPEACLAAAELAPPEPP